MAIDEINLPIGQKIILVIVLAIVNVLLWRNVGHFQLDSKPKKKPTDKARKLQNANYGAYIQAQGRYYN
ncbi:hypothetical protein ABQH43_05695 [Streptococcus sp. ZJ100]|uniref:hypothetical protein n=1 Tax=Streptococcus handemini TaxID=3161188 RepID=UPI0032EE8752